MKNALSACDLKNANWSMSYDQTSYCTQYSITEVGREKVIAKSSPNSFIQVHCISHGKSIDVSITDMVMFHLRVGMVSSGGKTVHLSRRMKRLLHNAFLFDHE